MYVLFHYEEIFIIRKRIDYFTLRIISDCFYGGGCAVLCSKTGRREVPGSIPGRTCRPSHTDFSVVFFETHVNAVSDPLERPPTECISPIGLGTPPVRQSALNPTTNQLLLLL